MAGGASQKEGSRSWKKMDVSSFIRGECFTGMSALFQCTHVPTFGKDAKP